MEISRLTDAGRRFAESSVLALFIIIVLLLIVVIIVFIVYRLRRSDLQSVRVLAGTLKTFDRGDVYRFDAMKIPATLNGQEYTYSMWIFVAQYLTADRALVLTRGGSAADISTANPIVSFEKNTNKLNIAVKTTGQPRADGSTAALRLDNLPPVLSTAATKRYETVFLTATIDYVPLQRWVHVCFSIQDNLLTIYLDGDIYTVKTLNDMPRASEPTATDTTRPVFASTSGNVYLGPYTSTGYNATQRAYMAKVEFFNHAVSQTAVRDIYRQGPVTQSLLGRMGLPDYGLRSPVYRLEA